MEKLLKGPESERHRLEYWQADPPKGVIVRFELVKPATDRMVAQQGAYTVSDDIFADHDDLIATVLDDVGAGQAYGTVRIPQDAKPEFLHELQQMNITAASLFPGLDGAGRAASEQIRVACWPLNPEAMEAGEALYD